MLIAIKNPKEQKNSSWLYNVFFKNITKISTNKNEKKVNWILEATKQDIEKLKDRGCEIIILKNGISNGNGNMIPINTEYKQKMYKIEQTITKVSEGFSIIYELFEKFMKEDKEFINKVKTNLPKDKYDKIILAKMMKKVYDNG